jgi:hypothetical protein
MLGGVFSERVVRLDFPKDLKPRKRETSVMDLCLWEQRANLFAFYVLTAQPRAMRS